MLTLSRSNSGRTKVSPVFLGAIVALATALTTVTATGAQAATAHAAKHSKYYRAALAAARKYDGSQTTISHLKEASGFATAVLDNPSRSPQTFTAIFRVRSVRSMRVIASGSAFDPIGLAELRMPFATQVRLTWVGTERSLRRYVAKEGYYGGTSTPGWTGFDGSFGRRGWELDANTFDSLHHAVRKVIRKRNAHARASKKIIDVDAAYKFNRRSRVWFTKKTHVGHFNLTLAFVSRTGAFTKHALLATLHPGHAGGVPAYYTYSLDGHRIPR